MNLKGKRVLITGASKGIGYACAKYFANLGANLILTYYTNHDLCLKNKEELIKKYQVEVDIFKLDLTCEEDINNLYNFVNDKDHHLDILINNAALSLDSFYLDKTKDEFLRVLETNLVGTFLMMKYFSQITDYIINISSTDGIDTGSLYNLDYSASKAGINLITKYLSENDFTTKYFVVCPNWVKTESIMAMNQDYLKAELKRVKQAKLIEPIEVPRAIHKAISDNRESGSIIRIEGDSCE